MYCKTQLSVSELSVTLSSNIEKRWLSQLPGYAECKRNGDARHSGTLFNTSIDVKNGEARHSGTLFIQHSDKRQGEKIEKRPTVPLYLNELLS